jgi:hypothetical protein
MTKLEEIGFDLADLEMLLIKLQQQMTPTLPTPTLPEASTKPLTKIFPHLYDNRRPATKQPHLPRCSETSISGEKCKEAATQEFFGHSYQKFDQFGNLIPYGCWHPTHSYMCNCGLRYIGDYYDEFRLSHAKEICPLKAKA